MDSLERLGRTVAPARHWHQIKPKNRPASKRNRKLRNLGRLCVTTAVDRNSDMNYEISSAKSSPKLGDDPLFSLSTELLSRMAFPAQGQRQARDRRLHPNHPWPEVGQGGPRRDPDCRRERIRVA